MAQRHWHVIINPISGGVNKAHLPRVVRQWLPGWPLTFHFTEGPGHARDLALHAIANGADGLIAVGGDGTNNEVAQALLSLPPDQRIPLALVPYGSGNGLARHLRLPLQPERAFRALPTMQPQAIDVGLLEGLPFLCTAGLGFDAHVAHAFAHSKTRGLANYLRLAWQLWRGYQPDTYAITMGEQTQELTALVLTAANANQYGNAARLWPDASLHDGLLNLCALPPVAAWQAPGLVTRLFTGAMSRYPALRQWPFTEATITRPAAGPAHVDGEPVILPATVRMGVLPGAIRVMV